MAKKKDKVAAKKRVAQRDREEITWYSVEDFFSEKKDPKPVGKGYITSMGAVVIDRKMFDEMVKGKEA